MRGCFFTHIRYHILKDYLNYFIRANVFFINNSLHRLNSKTYT